MHELDCGAHGAPLKLGDRRYDVFAAVITFLSNAMSPPERRRRPDWVALAKKLLCG
jgi:hypothetical protein